MKIKKPTTPGQRGKINPHFPLSSGKISKTIKKQLTTSLRKKGGRNNRGRLMNNTFIVIFTFLSLMTLLSLYMLVVVL